MTDTGPEETTEPETLTVQDDFDAVVDTVADNTPIYLIADVTGDDGPDFLLSRKPDPDNEDTEVWRASGDEADTFRLGDIWDHYEPKQVVFYAEAEEYNPDEPPGNALADGPLPPPPPPDNDPDYLKEGTVVEEVPIDALPADDDEDDEDDEDDTPPVVATITGNPIADLAAAREQEALEHLRRVTDEAEAAVAAELVNRSLADDVPIHAPESGRSTTVTAASKTPSSDDDDDADPVPAESSGDLSPDEFEQADLNADGVVTEEEAAAYQAQIDALEAEMAAIDAEQEAEANAEAVTAEIEPGAEDPDAPEDVEDPDGGDDDEDDPTGAPPDVDLNSPEVQGLSKILWGDDDDEDPDDGNPQEIDPYDVIFRAVTGDPVAMQSVVDGFLQAYDDEVSSEDFIKRVLPPRPEGPMAMVDAWDAVRDEARSWLPSHAVELDQSNLVQPGQPVPEPEPSAAEKAAELTDEPIDDGDEPTIEVDENGEPVTASAASDAKKKYEAAHARYRGRVNKRRKSGQRSLSHEQWQQRVDAARISAERRRKARAAEKAAKKKGKGEGEKKKKKPTQKELKAQETGKLLKTFQRHSVGEGSINRAKDGTVTGKTNGNHVGLLNALNEAGWTVNTYADGSGIATSAEGQKLKIGAPKRKKNANPWARGQGTFGSKGEYKDWYEFGRGARREKMRKYKSRYM